MNWETVGQESVQAVLDLFLQVAPAVTVAFVAIAAVMLASRVMLRRPHPGESETARLVRQLAVAAIAASGLIAFVVALPIADSMRAQLLSLFGVVASAALALSSTTLIGNAMAGLMLRFVRHFRPGDFIEVEGHLGRVTQRGLLHVEIQTEDRDLETLPNSFLVAHPLKVVRASGTIVSATVSLGYDVPRTRVDELLCGAVEDAELLEGFVQILELGDHAITYRAAGFLPDPKTLLSARSRLRACMIDALHSGGVEIVSPTFMNQRALDPVRRVIPDLVLSSSGAAPETSGAPEDVIFDKAEAAASREELLGERKRLEARRAQIDEALPGAGQYEARWLEREKERIAGRMEQIDGLLEGDVAPD